MATVRKRKSKWSARITVRGQKMEKSLTKYHPRNEREALKIARQMEREMNLNALSGEKACGEKSFALKSWLVEYCELRSLNVQSRHTASGLRSYISNFGKYTGDIPLTSVTRDLCERFQTDRLRNGGNRSTVRKEVTFLSAAFRAAVDRGLIGRNPWDGIPRPAENPANERFLTMDEFQRLLATAPPHRRLRYMMLAMLGQDRKQVAALTWGDIDWTRNSVRMPTRAKGGVRERLYRTMPVPDVLMSALEHFRAHDDEPVLTGAVSNWRRDLLLDVKNAGIKGHVRIKDLRHTCASWLAESGASLMEIGEYLGHRSPQTTKKYVHLTPDYLSGPAQSLSEKWAMSERQTRW